MILTKPEEGGKIIPLESARRQRLSDRTDDELMELAATDPTDAMSELIRRYHERVRSYCRKWDARCGDDLAQDVFLKLWNARPSYRPEGQFPVYLFTIVRNVCRNVSRQWFRRPVLGFLSASVMADHSPDQLDKLLQVERNRRINHEIS